MGRRRRKVVRVVKRRLPKIFTCPNCGEDAVRVELHRSSRRAVVQCSACHLAGEFEVSPANQIVDIYCKFNDDFHSGRIKPSETTVTVVEVVEGSGEETSAPQEVTHLEEEEESPEDEEEEASDDFALFGEAEVSEAADESPDDQQQ
jgi:transcription elongation factor Elf1